MYKSLIFVILTTLIFSACTLQPKPPVHDYDSCVAAGNPVMESYPPSCSAHGRNYIQDIGNELELQDQIHLDNPRPNQVITSPLEVSGQARGTWYNEATFPITLVGKDGTVIASASALAQSDWMTPDFVPFKATLNFTSAGKKTPATLKLGKANPSGKPENDLTLHLPVKY